MLPASFCTLKKDLPKMKSVFFFEIGFEELIRGDA